MQRLLLFILLLLSQYGSGQNLNTNEITGTNPGSQANFTSGAVVDPAITATGISKGSGIVAASANDRYNASNWNSATRDINDYFEFTMSPNASAVFSFISFSFDWQTSNTGPTTIMVTSSLNAHSTALGDTSSFSAGTTGTITIPLTAPNFQNLTAPITFRIYGWGASAAGGTFSINRFSFSGNAFIGKISASSGDWNNANTWIPVGVPIASERVLIKATHRVYTNSAIVRNAITQVYGTFAILSESALPTGSTNFQYTGIPSRLETQFTENTQVDIPNTAIYWPTTNGPSNVDHTRGLLRLMGNRTIEEELNVGNNIGLAGIRLNSGVALRLNGQVRLKTQGFFDNPPIYGPTSNLIYAGGGTFERYNEWNYPGQGVIGVSPGYPNHVTVTNGTTFGYNNAGIPGGSRACEGNLSIDTNSNFYMNWGMISSNGILSVKGNVNINSGCNLVLGQNFQDDLALYGDLNINGGNFDSNNRAIVFSKASGIQNVNSTAAATVDIDYILYGAVGNREVKLNCNVNIPAAQGGACIRFLSSNDYLNFAGYSLTIGTSGIYCYVDGVGQFKGSLLSNLSILGANDLGVMSFASGFQDLSTLTVNRSPGASAVTLRNLKIHNNLILTNGLLLVDGNLTLGSNTPMIINGSASSYVVAYGQGTIGTLTREILSAGTYRYPIGDTTTSPNGAEYSPMSVTFPTGAYSNYLLGLNTIDNVPASYIHNGNYISRAWFFSRYGTCSNAGDIVFNGTYFPTDVVGTEVNMVSNANISGLWMDDGEYGGANSLIYRYAPDYSIDENGSLVKGIRAPDIELNVSSPTFNGVVRTLNTYTIGLSTPGLTTEYTVNICNEAGSTLTFNTPTITGAGFSIVGPVDLTPLGPGECRAIIVRHVATVNGTATGVLNIVNNDNVPDSNSNSENPFVVNFNVTVGAAYSEINVKGIIGANPNILTGDVTPNPLDNTLFAAQNIGVSQTKNFRIENLGTGPLVIPSINVLGINPSDFTVNGLTFPLSIPAFSNQDFSITFTPTALGTRTAIISINNNDATGSENPYTFMVQGDGLCSSYNITCVPATGPVGTEVVITATTGNINGANVSFGGIPSTTVIQDSPTQVRAIVPSGANSGALTVTNLANCPAYTNFSVIENIASSCAGTGPGGVTPTQIFISEVTDSNFGGMSYVEIYNPTAAAINLATPVAYSIHIFNNGGATASTSHNLLGTIPAGGSHIVALGLPASCSVPAGSNGSLANSNQRFNDGGINFNPNGHDYIRLVAGATNIDSWGVYMNNNWAPASIGDQGAQFIRRPEAIAPNNTYNGADWIIVDFPGTDCANNNYSNIGSHDYLRGNPPTVSAPVLNVGCKQATISITATEGVAGGNPLVFQWYVLPVGSSTWTALTNAGIYSGVSTNTLTISNIATILGNQYYCIVRENTATCSTPSNAVKLEASNSVTWNGVAWSPSFPTINNAVIINGNYNTTVNGNFECCSLTVKNGFILTVGTNDYVKVDNDLEVEVGANMNIENSGSLVMVQSTGTVAANNNMSMVRIPRPMNRFDYTYWSTPMGNTIPTVAFAGWRLDYAFTFNTANFQDLFGPNGIGGPDGFDDDGNVWVPMITGINMQKGKGYAIMGPTSSPTYPNSPTVTFTGNYNTGNTVISVATSLNTANANDDYNLIGNPYPSAIHAPTFITGNSNLSGTLYFWTHCLPISASNPGPAALNFATNDYAMYNLTGGTQASPNCGSAPTDYIASGQGFFVEAINAGSAVFTNAMRATGVNTNNSFFRNTESSSVSRDRLWLDFVHADGLFSQTLLAYSSQTTLDYDWAYDGIVNEGGNSVGIYTFINQEPYRIQSRSAFFSEDIVPIGYKTEYASNYSIQLSNREGVFSDESPIYLEDKLLNVFHDLKQGAYQFQTQSGVYNDRFQLRYQLPLYVKDNTSSKELVVSSKSGWLGIKSENTPITKVILYDVAGRKLIEKEIDNLMLTEMNLINLTDTVIIANIHLNDGRIVNKKVRL